MPPRRSQSKSKGRASATPRRATSRRRSASPAMKDGPPSRATQAAVLSAAEAARIAEMRQVEAILAGRSRSTGAVAGARGAGSHRGCGFWTAIIVLEVVAFLWLRWACEVYAEMKARYSK